MVFVVSRYKLLIWSQQMKELRFFFYFVYKVQRDTWVLEDWQIISLFCVCDLTVYYNAAWIPMNNSACVYNQNRYSFQRAAQSLLWLCEAFSFVCRTGNIFNSSGSGCRFCSELWWVRFQKIPGLRIDCFIFWDAFTLPILFHPPANRRCPHYASSHKQQSCGMGESALHNSSSTTAMVPIYQHAPSMSGPQLF